MYLKPDSQKIRRNFGLIAHGYDRANDCMSLGLLHRWRKQLVDLSGVQKGQRVLDAATGTGDLALLFSRAVGEQGTVVGLDFTEEMLEIARDKEWRANQPVRWQIGDVLDLSFEDDVFDVSSIAFGIRNVESPEKGLKELARVTKPGGKILVLETGQPDSFLWKQVCSAYFGQMIPKIGGLLSGHKGPYEFLHRSTMGFPSGRDFVRMMKDLNVFLSSESIPLMGGVAYIYVGVVR